jgi:2-(1,2-epoxy-1,2-dihydrophenyl)acetyl-CoA isomerase
MSVECDVADGIATILFDRPAKLNALTDEMWDRLAAHLDRCKSDDAVRAVILTGAGHAFCAGADMSGRERIWPRNPGSAGTIEIMQRYNDVIRRLYHLPKPTIAAVRGGAVGIAWTMAMCCDWILASESARFHPPFAKLAKIPEAGFGFLLSRIVGELKARDIVYRSTPIGAAEAIALGLASRLVSDATLMGEAQALAREAADAAPITFALTKELFNGAGEFEQYLDRELSAIAVAANTEDAIEGTVAYREKRTPRYVGR